MAKTLGINIKNNTITYNNFFIYSKTFQLHLDYDYPRRIQRHPPIRAGRAARSVRPSGAEPAISADGIIPLPRGYARDHLTEDARVQDEHGLPARLRLPFSEEAHLQGKHRS